MKIKNLSGLLLLICTLTIIGVIAGCITIAVTMPKKGIVIIPKINMLPINFSRKLREKAINIAENNSKVARFLKKGYTISEVRPIYKLKLSRIYTNKTNVIIYQIDKNTFDGVSLTLKKGRKEIDVFIDLNTSKIRLIWDATNSTVIYNGS